MTPAQAKKAYRLLTEVQMMLGDLPKSKAIKDGNRRYTTEIVADRIQLLGSRGASSEVMNDDDLPE